jgi:hypothetical protein
MSEPLEVARTPDTVVVSRERSSAGWWIAALVAIVAVALLAFTLTSNRNNDAQLQAARDQGAAEASLDSATASAQMAAAQATQAARSATDQATAATQAAASTTADAARSTAAAAGDMAGETSTTESDTPQ